MNSKFNVVPSVLWSSPLLSILVLPIIKIKPLHGIILRGHVVLQVNGPHLDHVFPLVSNSLLEHLIRA